MSARLTMIQIEVLAAVERTGFSDGAHMRTINSLRDRGLIETATIGTPHPTWPNARWRLTEAGTEALEAHS